MANKTIRLVTTAGDGTIRERDFTNFDELTKIHEQIGIDDCSTDLTLRGMPIFRGLIGPIPESKQVARYESPEVFESLTKEWSAAKTKRRRRKSTTPETTGVPTPMAIPVNPTMVSMPGEWV